MEFGGWAIWSRRPQDPSHAPSIIISPNARPPPHIVQQALDLPTPPPSPTISTCADNVSNHSLSPPSEVLSSSQTTTETIDSPAAIPASPFSTNTSLSAPTDTKTDIVTPPVLAQATELVEAQSKKQEAALGLQQPTTPPPAKKSWAALLRPPTPSSGLKPTKNSLPTSSVVGFSIPASALVPSSSVSTSQQIQSSSAFSLSPSKKVELLALLNASPTLSIPPIPTYTSATSSTSHPLTRPRGIINTGNMCFANSVLQVLLCCPPFYHLFTELGRILDLGADSASPPLSSSTSPSSNPTSNTSTNPKVHEKIPLVDATVRFIREFNMPSAGKEKGKGKGKERASTSSGAYIQVNGSGRGYGAVEDSENDGDFGGYWDGPSFIPTYVYDALKDKKRFEHMRGGHQEDAEEFLGFYLDTLEEELLYIVHSISPPPPPAKGAAAKGVVNGVEEREEAEAKEDGWMEVGKRNRTVLTRTIKSTDSPITRIFGGKFRSTLRVPHQKDSVVVEDWRSLRVDIQKDTIHTIQDALSSISQPQPVQIQVPHGHSSTSTPTSIPSSPAPSSQPSLSGQALTHPHPPPPQPLTTTVTAHQQILIELLPSVLVVQMKRFCYDPAEGGVVKVGRRVAYDEELVVDGDVLAPTAKRLQGEKYKLFGIIYHHGISAGGGHYTLDVLHPNRYLPSSNTTMASWDLKGPEKKGPSKVGTGERDSTSGRDKARDVEREIEGWIRIDDELLFDISLSDVFGDGSEANGVGGVGRDETRCAYLLFYRKVR